MIGKFVIVIAVLILCIAPGSALFERFFQWLSCRLQTFSHEVIIKKYVEDDWQLEGYGSIIGKNHILTTSNIIENRTTYALSFPCSQFKSIYFNHDEIIMSTDLQLAIITIPTPIPENQGRKQPTNNFKIIKILSPELKKLSPILTTFNVSVNCPITFWRLIFGSETYEYITNFYEDEKDEDANKRDSLFIYSDENFLQPGQSAIYRGKLIGLNFYKRNSAIIGIQEFIFIPVYTSEAGKFIKDTVGRQLADV